LEERNKNKIMIQLLHGDCLELMKSIPDASIDAIITDPPYGTTACKWDSVIDFTLMWEQLNRIIKPNGAIVLFGSEPFSSALRMSNIKNYKYDWVWVKEQGTGFLNAKKQPLRNNEQISIFYKKQPTYNPQMVGNEKRVVKRKNIAQTTDNYGFSMQPTESVYYGRLPNNTIELKRDKEKLHPTQKPVELMKYLIKTYTNEYETVLDFTMGSGSTGVACRNINRSFIGIEMDEKYFEIAKKRIN
jgi:DNA modification methylase